MVGATDCGEEYCESDGRDSDRGDDAFHLGLVEEAGRIEGAVLEAVRREEDDAGHWRETGDAGSGGVGGENL